MVLLLVSVLISKGLGGGLSRSLRFRKEGLVAMKTTFTDKELLANLREVGGQQTVSHVKNVALLMQIFAHILSEDEVVWYHAGLRHDAGKLYVSPAILNKTSALTPEERIKVKVHAQKGRAIGLNIKGVTKEDLDCICYHHAWYQEGSERSYYWNDHVEQKFGKAIPYIARACALCDVFEACIAKRSYGDVLTVAEAISVLVSQTDKGQFDPYLSHKFIAEVIPWYLSIKEKIQREKELEEISY